MTFPYSIKFICALLALIGCRSDYKFKRAWQNRMARFYCHFYTVTSVVALLAHILGTTTRAVRELPEFLQRLLEDLAFTLFLVDCLLFKYNFKVNDNIKISSTPCC
uniref:Uncharacterized protein n=1 Tax=Cacopsylla melanoneura TaxID=428564 RepID=A0A8D8W4G3_9HEMI